MLDATERIGLCSEGIPKAFVEIAPAHVTVTSAGSVFALRSVASSMLMGALVLVQLVVLTFETMARPL